MKIKILKHAKFPKHFTSFAFFPMKLLEDMFQQIKKENLKGSRKWESSQECPKGF
jgi:hypothetical protein